MTRSVRHLFPIAVLCLAGCGGDDGAEFSWAQDDEVAGNRVTSYQGSSHCGPQSATFLHVDRPLTPFAPDGVQTYVRDPEGVFA